MRRLTLKDIQEISLNILVYFDEFCKKNNIMYSLGGGTLIGAIRHKGFIPWDDDVDVYMLRDDYNKFIDLWNKESHKKYELSSAEDISGIVPGGLTKIFDKETILIDRKGLKSHIFLDVFVFDGVPDNSKLLYKEMKKHHRIKLRFSSCRKRWYRYKNRFFYYIFYKLSVYLFNKMMLNLNRIQLNYPIKNANYIGLFLFDYYRDWKRSYMKKEYFNSVKLVSFENHFFPVMNGYHEHLTIYYGDYMKYPPLDEQKPSHSLEAYSLNK